jgi:hypothetical protein
VRSLAAYTMNTGLRRRRRDIVFADYAPKERIHDEQFIHEDSADCGWCGVASGQCTVGWSNIPSKNGERRSRVVPGHEFSGVVAGVGEDTAGFDIGHEIYGMNDWFSDGAMAEYCITQPTSVAQKPPRLTHVAGDIVPAPSR